MRITIPAKLLNNSNRKYMPIAQYTDSNSYFINAKEKVWWFFYEVLPLCPVGSPRGPF
jgi:hypothetical protein